MSAAKSYTAKDIKQLEGLEHVRHRVSMYLGSNSDAGVTTAAREIIDNSVDEALAGHGKDITIRFFQDGSVEVADHGRGLPVDKNADGVSGIVLTVGMIGSGGKFNADNYKVSGGLNGIGSAAANASALRFSVTVFRDGKRYELSFQKGKPGHFAKPNDPNAAFTPGDEVKVGKDTRSAAERKVAPTGTTIRFWPDFTVFLPGSKILVDDIKFRVRSTAFLVPGLKFTVVDGRDNDDNPQVDEYYFDGGLLDMLPTLTHHPLVSAPIRLVTEGKFTETRNVVDGDGKSSSKDVERQVEIETAFGYTNVEDTILRSYVNIINTQNGGTHESGLWRALSRVLVNYIKNTKGLLKSKEEPPTLEDVRDGFVGVISVKFPEPAFTGQEKSTLATPQMTSVVSQAVGAELQKWLGEKKNAKAAKVLGQKIVEASRIRLAAKQQKEVARKKSALETAASMPAKLVPAASKNPDEVSLMLCEGDSALGGLKQARDANVTAIFPLRGKPLNAYDLTLGQVLKNQEWADLIQIVGAGVGKEFKVEDMNYSKIILLADSDADGSHIRALLIAGIHRLMPGLIEQGRLYAALPPLFSITTSGKNKEKYYALNDVELDKLVSSLKKKGKKWDKITRHKGLGEYSPDILHEVVMDPETRVLKQITVDDAQRFEDVLELTMGKNAAGRRDWIVDNRSLISEDDIDA